MDKRSLITALFVALMLFGVNLYFNSQREKRTEIARQEQCIKKQEHRKKQAQIALERTASLQELPLEALTKGTQSVGLAVRTGEHYLCLADEGAPLEAATEKGQPLTRLASGSGNRTPALYGRAGAPKFRANLLPQEGEYELQLVWSDSNGSPQVTYALLIDGELELPLSPPTHNAIALIHELGGYRPIAVYWAAERTLSPLAEVPALARAIEPSSQTTTQAPEEQYYVLENGYQQIVFSTLGGAITEINLPFESDDNLSIVKEIGYDRTMEEEYPANDHYPDYPYYTAGDSPEGPYTYHERRELGGYYPLLRRDLVDPNSGKTIKVPPRYYAFNVVSKHPEVSTLQYKVVYFDKRKLVMEAEQNHRKITKTFEFPDKELDAPYMLNIAIEVEGASQGLWVNTGVPEVEMLGNKPAPALKYRLLRNNKSEIEKISLPKLGKPVNVSGVYPSWVGNTNAFFGIILNPLDQVDPGYRAENVPVNVVPSRLLAFNSEYQRFKPSELTGYTMQLPLPKEGGVTHFRFYSGPLQDDVLKRLDATYTDPETGSNPDYIGAKTFHGLFKFISKPFSKLLFWIMQLCYWLTSSWGLSIILLTVVLRIILYPLNAWSLKSMRRMQRIQPEIQAVQAKYKKEPRKAQMEVMNLYRKKKVNPLMGCVPMLIQMPFLIAMFDLLKSSFDLRGAVFIPGWIDNLTAPDVLFSWNKPIFFFGSSFHLLPILLAGVMFLQQRLMSKLPKDKTLWTDQQRQQRMMGNMMVIMFSVLFYNFASGLNIYWLSSMSLSILQQWITNRTLDKQDAKEKAKKKSEPSKGKKGRSGRLKATGRNG